MPGKNVWKLSKVWGNISKYAKWTLHSKDFSYSSKNIIDPDITIYHSTVLLTSTSILRNKMFFFVLSREAHFLSQQVSSVSSMNTGGPLSLVLSLVTLKDHFLSLRVSTVCPVGRHTTLVLLSWWFLYFLVSPEDHFLIQQVSKLGKHDVLVLVACWVLCFLWCYCIVWSTVGEMDFQIMPYYQDP